MVLWRLRLNVGGQAEYLGALLDREIKTEMAQLDAARKSHAPAHEVEQLQDEAVHLIDVRRDITTGLIEDHLEFIRVRVRRGGQADTLRDVLLAEQENLLEKLADCRARGLTEEDPEITQTREELFWLVNTLRDVGIALVELAGPNVDQR